MPLDLRTVTVTSRDVIATGWPFCLYSVGCLATSVSWYGVNLKAVDTVWLHATVALWPIRISGTPYSATPETLSCPGIVSWAW